MAAGNGWSVWETENGAIFNAKQLSRFKVGVWNNTSGKVLTVEQRRAFQNYLKQGGGFVSIHAADDYSHKWPGTSNM